MILILSVGSTVGEGPRGYQKQAQRDKDMEVSEVPRCSIMSAALASKKEQVDRLMPPSHLGMCTHKSGWLYPFVKH